MRILLIGNKETSQNVEDYYGQYAAFFKKAVDTTGNDHTIEFTLFDELVIAVGDGDFSIFDTRHNLELSEYQLILIRGKGFRNLFDVVKSISSYAKLAGIPIVNDYSGFRDSSKLTQAVQFHELDIPVAKTVYATPAVLEEKRPLGFELPCIMKAVFGAHGNDNYLVHSMQEARDIAAKSPSIRFVMQRFVPNDNDYRLLIVGDKELVIGREAVEGSHLNNTSQGAQAVLAQPGEVPQKVIDDARRIMEYLDMTVAGVDVLADKNTGEFYFLEVNSQPQLMSGAFIDDKAKIIGQFFDSLA